METIGKGIIGIVLVVASCALWGHTFVWGWSWFVVPVGFQPITFWQGYGLSALIGLSRLHTTATLERIHTSVVDGGASLTFDKFVSRTFSHMFASAMTLGCMWLFKVWM
jgi:hypothetical protein